MSKVSEFISLMFQNHWIKNDTAQHKNMAGLMPKVFEEANLSGELRLSGRKLKDFPKTAAKYNLSDTVIAGKIFLFFISFHCKEHLFVFKILRLVILKNTFFFLTSANFISDKQLPISVTNKI